MAVSFALAAPANGIYRVARGIQPFTFRKPDSPLPVSQAAIYGGNRWDDPAAEYATLYCASSAETAFGETIARYRERPGLIDKVNAYLEDAPDPEYDYELRAGCVPDEYFDSRYLGHVSVDEDARFVDVEHSDSHRASRPGLLPLLAPFDVPDVDRSTFLSPDRRITQTIARYYWTLSGLPDHKNWYGLRYTSRLDRDWECWAIWENPLRQSTAAVQAITRTNPHLLSAARKLGVKI